MKNNTGTSDLKSFHYLENGEITFSNLDTTKTCNSLDSGEYEISWKDYPEYRIILKKKEIFESVKSYSFPDKNLLESAISSFVDVKVKSKIKNLGFNHKLGVLLYGKEGTGKSTIIKYFTNRLIKENNAIVFIFTGPSEQYLMNLWDFVEKIRKIQNNPIVIVLDEIDSYFTIPQNEANLKKILDSSSSIDNSIFFASTNYIDKIPEAIKNRPSRFKYTIDIQNMSKDEDIYTIMSSMIGDMFSESEIYNFITEIDNKSLDYIKQFCLDKIMNIENHKAIKKQGLGFKINSY